LAVFRDFPPPTRCSPKDLHHTAGEFRVNDWLRQFDVCMAARYVSTHSPERARLFGGSVSLAYGRLVRGARTLGVGVCEGGPSRTKRQGTERGEGGSHHGNYATSPDQGVYKQCCACLLLVQYHTAFFQPRARARLHKRECFSGSVTRNFIARYPNSLRCSSFSFAKHDGRKQWQLHALEGLDVRKDAGAAGLTLFEYGWLRCQEALQHSMERSVITIKI